MVSYRIVPTCVLVAAVLLVAACGESPEAAKPAAKAEIPAGVLLNVAPANAKSVTDVKATAKSGDDVVFTARVGGRKDPFVADRAIVMVMDAALPDCSATGSPMPLCKTPWDYCCDEATVISKNAATVQVAGADGKAIKADLKNFGEMKPGSTLTVVGKVEKNADGVMLVNATGIYVQK